MEARKFNSLTTSLENELANRDLSRKSSMASVVQSGEIVIIERRVLLRECLTRALRPLAGQNVLSFDSVENWLTRAKDVDASIVVLSIGRWNAGELERDIARLTRGADNPPLVIFSDADEPQNIIMALEKGARGFVPTNLSLDIMVQALRLVGAGGVFAPASSLLAASQLLEHEPSLQTDNFFTGRQFAVAEALSKGKSNKLIAYELAMCESTVKVHVRNIMKKLKARNRTEVAVMVNAMVSARGVNDSAK